MEKPNSLSLNTYPSDPDLFFPWLKEKSEEYWSNIELNHKIYGFQIQPGTIWNPGLSETEILSFERAMGFKFPPIYKLFLKHMNGTDKDTINVYADSGEKFQYSAGYYSYPKDLTQMKELIQWIYESKNINSKEVETEQISHILPIVSHRFLVVDRCGSNPVLSMYGDDIIAYARNLMVFLYYDIFHHAAIDPELEPTLKVNFWL